MEKESSVFKKGLFAGLVGGILFATAGSMAYFLSFSDVSHASFVFRSFFDGEWTTGWIAESISIVITGIIGVIPALIYYLLFKKLRGMMPGLIYGIALWFIVFGLLNPLFSYVPDLFSLNMDTIATTMSQFILYGVFIGYTISYEHHDQRFMRKVSQNN
ncbi:YqhR family membrane protein [Alkalibacillus haloalkaliphilus]|uniref:Membrane protein YqhR n=1 Tax=Alkalibacillus haloalkaliphilus TaxID=94136 RepID=A0A511W2J0_9BACI|nr:YqhR family membrane protein [Alkalibacillus haloalkaliphilus]GEN45295.1 hypothetical protein AHA02nite_10710 [Alkalibacillus haloalkaliphilus]